MKRVLAVLLAVVGTTFGADNYLDWAYRTKITVNTSSSGGGAGVTETQTNFPLALRLTPDNFDPAFFANTKAGGADIRFAKNNGTHLKYQIERWVDGASNADTAAIWVRADTIFGDSAGQFIWMYWGNADAADSSNANAVFDTSFMPGGVWHLNEAANNDADGYKNSSAYGAGHFTGNSMSKDSIGVMGKCAWFDGSADYLGGGDDNYFDMGSTTDFCLYAWIKQTDTAGGREIISKMNTTGNPGYTCKILNGTMRVQYNDGSTNTKDFGNQNYTKNVWHLAVFNSNRDTKASGFFDGDSLGDENMYGVGNISTAVGLGIGRQPPSSNFFAGWIDEARVIKRLMSLGEIKLSYRTQVPGQTAVTVQDSAYPVYRSITGIAIAQSATVTGTAVHDYISAEGTAISQAASTAGTISALVSATGITVSQSPSTIGSMKTLIGMTGTVAAQDATSIATAKTIIGLTGIPASQVSTTDGAIKCLVAATGTAQSQSASSSGIIQAIIVLSGEAVAQSASASGAAKAIITLEGSSLSQSASASAVGNVLVGLAGISVSQEASGIGTMKTLVTIEGTCQSQSATGSGGSTLMKKPLITKSRFPFYLPFQF